MKVVFLLILLLLDLLFISHMVQMKVICGDVMSLNEYLYIPHGSDESRKMRKFRLEMYAFISHMVQMKELQLEKASVQTDHFISHMVQMKDKWSTGILTFI